jgi:NAD(P)H-flavin reductase
LRDHDLIIVAGGIGLAPLRPLIYEITRNRESFGRVNLVIGARIPELLLYRNEYDRWNSAGLNVTLTVDRASPGWAGSVGVVTPIIERMPIPSPEKTAALTCGPEVMMRYVAESAIARRIPATQIWVSLERHMQCAAGFCGHCQLGPAFVCKDGPVFRYDIMRRFLFVESL